MTAPMERMRSSVEECVEGTSGSVLMEAVWSGHRYETTHQCVTKTINTRATNDPSIQN